MTHPFPHADENGRTPLMKAAKKNEFMKIAELVEKKHDLNAKDHAGYTALMHAVIAGSQEAALMLMHHKAELHHANRAGQTALHVATEKGMDEIIERWATLKGPLDLQDNLHGNTPLMNAILAGNGWAACRLVDAGADYDTLKNNDGKTAEKLAGENLTHRDRQFFRAAIATRRAVEAQRTAANAKAVGDAARKLDDDVSAPAAAKFKKRPPDAPKP